MNDDIISQLQQATTDEQKTWIITEVTLKTLTTRLADAVKVAAIPHWFNVPVLAALLSVDAPEAEELYEGIKALSFSEPFGDLGYALHDLTRAGILSHLISTQPSFFQKLSQRAYEYFCQFEDAQHTVEAIYHLLATDKTDGMEKFKEQIQSHIESTKFSAANNLIRNARELVKLGRLSGAESDEIDWRCFLVEQRLERFGKREKAPEIKRQYAIQTFQVFNPVEDIGKSHFRKDFLTRKLMEFTRALERNPDYWALANRGEAYRLLDDYPAALADFTRALELNPDYAWALANRGTTYFLMGNYPAALADFTRALELNPDYAEALANRGETYRLLGDYPAALADFTRALELNTDYAWALANRGATYLRMDNYPAALADLTRALELNTDYAEVLANRGETYRLMSDYPSALADLNHTIKLEPQNEWAHYGRGLIFLIQNRSEQAQTDFSLAIQQASPLYEKNPEDWRNTFNLAIYHLAAGHVEEAESLYRKALTHSIPAGNLREAGNDLDDFLHLFPDHPQAKAMRDLLQQHLDETSSC